MRAAVAGSTKCAGDGTGGHALDFFLVSTDTDRPEQPEGGAQPPATARRPRVFSGTQPTGALHLGNYLGAIRNYVAMQETHDCVYCVVDLHAITVRQPKAELKRSTIETANMFLAAGVDPERTSSSCSPTCHSTLSWRGSSPPSPTWASCGA